ncbi:hypothetical protein UFOVP247_190 [uncultured Caudovirales phage]|uniref:Uncharacterized protein n=1 Tax=uncultured Caudovirales phage TaxID=2100421 RepID=A0A6J7WUW1_9CAUD|nr:hypothetical protein UFOVP247_190 [uncultured Caudovirales phage]
MENYYWYEHKNSPDNSIPDVFGTTWIIPGMGQWVLIHIKKGNAIPNGAIHCNDVIERLQEWSDNAQEKMGVLEGEIERLQKYESLVNFIASDYHELSYEKAQWQRDDWKKRCITLQQKDSE